jgi:uncharacterized protein YcfJ
MNAKIVIAAGAMLAMVPFLAPAANAAGCIKGAVVGGVAGHFVGHHGLAGAAAGCVIGHHEANVRARENESDHGYDRDRY